MSTNAPLTDSAVSSDDATVYTFSSMALGAADADRYILVGIAGRAGGNYLISSVTVGGETAVVKAHLRANQAYASWYLAAVPTGTTGDVVVTYNNNMARVAIGVYRLVGLVSDTATDAQTSSADPATVNLNIAANGVAFGLACASGTQTSISWTNLTSDVNAFAAGWEANGNAGWASADFASAQTGLALTGDFGSAASGPSSAFVSFELSGGGATTHATTGVLAGAGGAIDGTAAHIAIHGTSGVLAGSGATVDGSAARTRAHPTSGVLAGSGGVVDGTARHNVPHPTTGVLAGGGGQIDGAADHVVPGGTHDTSGALVGGGGAVSGTAAHIAVHGTSGVLAGAGGAVVGAAARVAAAVTHDTSGALVGGGGVVDGLARGPDEDVTGGQHGFSMSRMRRLVKIRFNGKLYQAFEEDIPELLESLEEQAEQKIKKKRNAKAKPAPVAVVVSAPADVLPDLKARIADVNRSIGVLWGADEDEDEELLWLML